MSEADAQRWDQRYANKRDEGTVSFEPDPLLLRHRSLFKAGQRALDVACGTGHNSLWLAAQGLHTTALDISAIGLELLQREAAQRDLQIETIVADLDQWRWPPEAYDVIVVLRFLDRSLFNKIKKSLNPGGLVVYQTFGPARLQSNPDFNPNFVLRAGELTERFQDFAVIEQNDADGNFATLVARKPGA